MTNNIFENNCRKETKQRRGFDIDSLPLILLVLLLCLLLGKTSFSKNIELPGKDAYTNYGKTAAGFERSPEVSSISGSNCYFIENKGQWDSRVKFLARLNNLNAWITTDGLVCDFYSIQHDNEPAFNQSVLDYSKSSKTGTVIKMQYVPALEVQPTEFKPKGNIEGVFNYFLGNDPAKWVSRVQRYEEVTVASAYKNIDIRYYFDGGSLRYDFILNPGARIQDILLRFEGTLGIQNSESGELELLSGNGVIFQKSLEAYQYINGEKILIPCSFRKISDQAIGFDAAWADPSLPLIIDPLIFSTFLGGSDGDGVDAFVYDDEQNIVLTGNTQSIDFPITLGAYDSTIVSGDDDAYISKLSSDGSSLLFSTYIGGTGHDMPRGIAITGGGNIVFGGFTYDGSFPVTPDAYDPTFNAFPDGFISILSPDGSELVYSTFFGCMGRDGIYSLALDPDGNILVCGSVESSGFPVTQNAIDPTFNGSQDAFVAKFNSSGTTLLYSSYLGGASFDFGWTILSDAQSNVIVYGSTLSGNFPVTDGAFDLTFNGGWSDLFITKFDSNFSGMVFSTFFGGSSDDTPLNAALSTNGDILVLGCTPSTDFPVTANAYDSVYSGGEYDGFFSKLSSDGTHLLASSYIGGHAFEYCFAGLIQPDEEIVIAGSTGSPDFPVTPDAYDASLQQEDGFICRFNPDGSQLIYSTFIGGSSGERPARILAASSENILIAGRTTSTNYPTTPDAYDVSFGGWADAFVTNIDISSSSRITSPNGGESWEIGSVHPISWSSGSVPLISLEYSTYNGISWMPIVSSIDASLNSYAWTIPATPSLECYVRILDAQTGSLLDNSDNDFSIPFPPSVALISPNGGEHFLIGEQRFIKWNFVTVQSVNLHFSSDGGASWTPLASSIPSSLSVYPWEIPDIASEQCRIKISAVSDSSVFDISDDNFSIRQNPPLTVISPNGGEVLASGSSAAISWEHLIDTPLRIDYTTDKGVSWILIADNIPAADHSYQWNVPATPSYFCKIIISSTQNPELFDTGNDYFTIVSDAYIQLLSPNGGERFFPGRDYQIRWSSSVLDLIDIEYSTNSGNSWNPVKQRYPAVTGSCNWRIPNSLSALCLVRILDSQSGAVLDISDLPFAIAPIPILTITAPNGGELLVQGQDSPIEWHAEHADTVLLEYTINNGILWTPIGEFLSSTGNYLWCIPIVTSNLCRIRLSDQFDETFYTISKNVFTIAPPEGMLPEGIPNDFELSQNYPNPFNPVTRIQYGIPAANHVRVTVYNVLGESAEVLVDEDKPAGWHFAEFDGSHFASGIYFVHIQSGNYAETKKMILLK